MTMVTHSTPPTPQSDLKTVVESRTREWHFHIYYLLQSPTETAAALALRDAVLRLRRDGESPNCHLQICSFTDFVIPRRFRGRPVVQSQRAPHGPAPGWLL